jgi:hypothetical protein
MYMPTIARTLDPFGVRAASQSADSRRMVAHTLGPFFSPAMPAGGGFATPRQTTEAEGADALPMRTPDFSYVPSQLDATPMLRRTPFVLAQRALREGQRAERIDRVTGEETPFRATSDYPATPVAMTLARSSSSATAPMAGIQPAQPVTIQREDKIEDTPAPTSDAGSAAAPDAGKLAEQVYTMLARRLLVERERGGYRRY